MYSTHRPVVIEVAELVGQPLHVVWTKPGCVTNDIEVSRSDGTLAYTLANQEEIIPTQSVEGGNIEKGFVRNKRDTSGVN